MNDDNVKIHNNAIKDVLRRIDLMQGYTLSRKLTVKQIKSCLIKKHKKVDSVASVKLVA